MTMSVTWLATVGSFTSEVRRMQSPLSQYVSDRITFPVGGRQLPEVVGADATYDALQANHAHQ